MRANKQEGETSMNTRIYVVGIIVLIVPFVYGGIGLWQAVHGLFGH